MSVTVNGNSSTKPSYAKLRFQLKGMRDYVNNIAVSPDSLCVAAITVRGEVQVWDILDGSAFAVKQPSNADVFPRGIAFSPNGKYLAAAIDKTVHVWIAKTGQPRFELVHPETVRSLVFSPDSKRLACGSIKDIHIWDVNTKQQVHVLKGHTDWVMDLSYFSRGTQLVSASDDSSLRVWSLEQREKLQDTWKGYGSKKIYCCAVSPDGQMLASGGDDHQVILWDVKSGDWLTRPYQGHNSWVSAVAFSPDGKHIASASGDDQGQVHIQDAKSGSFIAEVESSFHRVAYTPDGKHIITRDKEDPKLVRVLKLTTPAVPLPVGQTQGTSTSAQSTSSVARDAHPGIALDRPMPDDNWPPPYTESSF